MPADQFGDRNAGGFLRGGFMATDVCVRVPSRVSMRESIACADYAIERFIRASNHRVTEDQGAELRRVSVGRASSVRVQDRQFDWEIDCELRQRFHTRAHASRMHFAGWYHNDIALAGEALRSATPK